MVYETNRKALRPTVFILLAACISLWAADVQAAATVSGQTLVSSVRTGRTIFDYTYTLTLTNAQPALNSATVNVTSSVPSTVVLKSSVSVPAIAAGATLTTTDTLIIQQDRTIPFSWSNLTFTVVPGPGPVALGQVTAAAGGTIAVTDPGDPLFGTKVVIPPGALGDPEDTITIGYSNVLPGPLNPNAVQAGVIPVGPAGALALTLSKQGPSPFKLPVIVTVPYSTAALGIDDDPTVVYWNSSSAQYAAIQVLGVDHTQNQITFLTKHFSDFAPLGLPGLQAMLLGRIPFVPPLQFIDTGFDPSKDGFEAQNWRTGLNETDTNQGLCYGMTSYAVWYFREKPSATGLYAKYQTASDSGATHVPQEDELAREIMAMSQADVNGDVDDDPNPEGRPLQVLEQMLQELLDTQSPQLIDLDHHHSVVFYEWDMSDPSRPAFLIYDPNVPWPQPQPPLLEWSPQQNNFVLPWMSAENSYSHVYNGSSETHYDVFTLDQIYESVENGGPIEDDYSQGWRFNNLSIDSPLGASGTTPYPGGPTGPIVHVDPVNGTDLTVTWNCTNCVATNTYYLHVYQNGVEAVPQPIANNTSVSVPITLFTGASNELFAFVSTSAISSTGTTDQRNIRGLAGFQRVELAPASVQISVTTTAAGFIGLPATISLSGFFKTSIPNFEQNGDQFGNCLQSANTGERGYPLFSGTVDPTATFTGANNDTATPLGSSTMEPFPYSFNGPYPSYYPCSSFVAYDKPDANGNGKVWINAVGRGQGFNANTQLNTDWEYQVRYYSGDPAKQYSDASCTIGTVPDDDAYSGTPVQCTIKCNAALLGKLPACSN